MAPLINVDLLVQDEHGRTLLTWRDDEHFRAGWHLPGGIIRYKEHAVDRVVKCAEDELGTRVTFEPVPITVVETIREVRDRGHFISLLYRCRLAGEASPMLRAGDHPKRGEWRWFERAPEDLIKVHDVYRPFF
jgi:colanic acid biosynthesis protein WcaH